MLQTGQGGKFFGFKFVLPANFPYTAPMCYLDEKEDPELFGFIDYLKPGNKIEIFFLNEWSQQYKPGKEQQFNLNVLLTRLFNMMSQIPPINPFQDQ